MEQRTLRNVNNYLYTNIYSYLETSGGQSSNLYLKVAPPFYVIDNRGCHWEGITIDTC
jgi:hypothetical protein